METNKQQTVSVLHRPQLQEDESANKSMFPSIDDVVNKLTTVPVDVSCAVIADNLTRFIENISPAINNIPDKEESLRVDSVTLGLAINAKGTISFIGEASFGITPSITVTLKRK
jgi:hypothetical protein